MKKIGIVGASGYTGGELLRILRFHPEIELDFAYSTSYKGKGVSEIHPDLLGTVSLEFIDVINPEVDVVFLCLGHGNSKAFLKEHLFGSHTRIIDLSSDFRLGDSHSQSEWVYGLPEKNAEAISNAQFVANPGCFATAVQLALLPLANKGLLGEDIHVNAITGSTGAGSSSLPTTHFSWRNNNVSWYEPFTHQHLGEINATLDSFGEKRGHLYFLPQRGNFTRGIMATAYTKFKGGIEHAKELYQEYYKDSFFTRITEKEVHLKQVINTNFCDLHLLEYEDVILVTAVLDNLLKGASGQAVQNMNLMLGFDERESLNLKASIF